VHFETFICKSFGSNDVIMVWRSCMSS